MLLLLLLALVALALAAPTPELHNTGAFSAPNGNYQAYKSEGRGPSHRGHGPHGPFSNGTFNGTFPPHGCFNLTAFNTTGYNFSGPYPSPWNSTHNHQGFNFSRPFPRNETFTFANGTWVCPPFNFTLPFPGFNGTYHNHSSPFPFGPNNHGGHGHGPPGSEHGLRK